MKVIATKPGYHGKLRDVGGEPFDVPDGAKASWFVPVEADHEKKPAKAKPAKAPKPDDLV
jgi:hypothetical protein